MNIHRTIIIASVILLANLFSGCRRVEVAVAPDPQPTLQSALLVPSAEWSATFDANDLESIVAYNLVALRNAVIQVSQRLRVVEGLTIIDPNTETPVVKATQTN